jgi:type III secretion system YscI/HrpB-like protein
MSIAPVNAATQVANMSSPAPSVAKVPTPEQAEIEKFNQVMFSTGSYTPEQMMMNAVADHHQVLKTDLLPVTNIVQGDMSAENLLSAQEQLMRSAVGVDLGAKVAGQLSQAINKLVSMQ